MGQNTLYKLEEQHSKNYLSNLLSDNPLPSSFMAIKYYCGYRYREVNQLLRFGRTNEGLARLSELIISYLDREFKNCTASDNIVVVRWVDKKKFIQANTNLSNGTKIFDLAYISTSLHLGYCSDLENQPRNINNELLLIIKIPKGSSCLYLNHVSGREFEQEILLDRGSTLIVNEVFKVMFSTSVILCSLTRKK